MQPRGIYRHASNAWHNDKGSYFNQIGWDTTRYLNIYVNSAGGNLGYAYLPSGGGVVGQGYDGGSHLLPGLWPEFRLCAL